MTRCVVALLTSVAQRVGFHVLETRSGSSQHGPSRLWWRGLYMEVVQTLSFMLTGIPRFEVQQKMTDEALTHDPESGLPVKRVITGGSGIVTHGTSILSMRFDTAEA